MERLIKFIPFSSRPQMRQFYKFGIVGLTNTVVDFSVFLLLTRFVIFFGEHVLYANAISFSFAVTNSYLLNRKWTFRSTDGRRTQQYIKFFLINIAALGMNTGLLYVFVYHFHIYDFLAKILTVGVTLFWNFFLNKWLVFKK